MLLLPRIDEPPGVAGRKLRTSPLSACFHLAGPHGSSDLADLEALRQRKLAKSAAAAQENPLPPDSRSPNGRSSGSGRAGDKDGLSEPVQSSVTRSTQRFNGVDGISLSQAGSWLDCRAFAESCDGPGPASPKVPQSPGASSAPATSPQKGRLRRREVSEGERFILKRCKDTLLRRHGTLHNAFKKLDCSQSQALTIADFGNATGGLFKRAEVQILYRLLDDGREAVTLWDLYSLLDDL